MLQHEPDLQCAALSSLDLTFLIIIFPLFSDALLRVSLQNDTLWTSVNVVAFWTEQYFDPIDSDGSDL